jgi:nicotinate-nucleotide pyrophosphorylase (carboxylating)
MKKEINKMITLALLEDNALNDITSDLTIPDTNIISFSITPRENIIFCGTDIIEETFLQLKASTKFKNSILDLKILAKDGDPLTKSKPIATGSGDAKLIFAAERVLLNLVQHLSGISTITHQFKTLLNNDNIKILDTRKTLPGLRTLQKYAVKIGGGTNHRFDLSDLILIKDNHIAAAGGVQNAIEAAKNNKNNLKVEVECDNFEQVSQAILSNPDIIMLDNMTPEQITKCSTIIRAHSTKIQIEVSGGINIDTITNLKTLDIDFISIGSLTHSVKAVDIGLDII